MNFINTLIKKMKLKDFTSCASYNEDLDEIIFLIKDCSYRVKYVKNSLIHPLLHPYSDEIIGFKMECPLHYIKQYIKE